MLRSEKRFFYILSTQDALHNKLRARENCACSGKEGEKCVAFEE
jgi:hypothetical protein